METGLNAEIVTGSSIGTSDNYVVESPFQDKHLHQQTLLAQPNSTGIRSRGIDMEIGSNPEIVTGQSLASNYTSENVVENTAEPGELDRELHQPLQNQKVHHEQEQQPIQDGTQFPLAPHNNESLQASEELSPRPNKVGDEFVPSLWSPTGSSSRSEKTSSNTLGHSGSLFHLRQATNSWEKSTGVNEQLNRTQRAFVPSSGSATGSSARAEASSSNTKLNPLVLPFVPSSLSNSWEKNTLRSEQLNRAQLEFVPSSGSATGSSARAEASSSSTKLNPLVLPFVPSKASSSNPKLNRWVAPFVPSKASSSNNWGKKIRASDQSNMAQQEDRLRRTIYVSFIHHEVTEEYLAGLLESAGQIVDYRIWGDTTLPFRFGFLEFTDEDGAGEALKYAHVLAYYNPTSPMCFAPSKTAIVPINPAFLPNSEDEMERCTRTIYCKNIDKNLSQADVKLLFESSCGKIVHFRMLGDLYYDTQYAFVEFVTAASAKVALSKSGATFGTLPIRVCPSKTPVRLHL